jgi:hypothetical protein
MGDSSPTHLPHVVIIPQRRPKQRDRGFVRAYAPDLMRCGIDEATFLSFIDSLNQTVAAHPTMGMVSLVGAAVGQIPPAIGVVTPILGLGIQVAAGIYKEVQSRKRYILFKSCEFFCSLLTRPLLP